jgi:hypothetical protein
MEIILYKSQRTLLTEIQKQRGGSIMIMAHTQSWGDAESKLPQRCPRIPLKLNEAGVWSFESSDAEQQWGRIIFRIIYAYV